MSTRTSAPANEARAPPPLSSALPVAGSTRILGVAVAVGVAVGAAGVFVGGGDVAAGGASLGVGVGVAGMGVLDGTGVKPASPADTGSACQPIVSRANRATMPIIVVAIFVYDI